jgi:hypothetical protein
MSVLEYPDLEAGAVVENVADEIPVLASTRGPTDWLHMQQDFSRKSSSVPPKMISILAAQTGESWDDSLISFLALNGAEVTTTKWVFMRCSSRVMRSDSSFL